MYTHIHVHKHITYPECGWTDGIQELMKYNSNNNKKNHSPQMLIALLKIVIIKYILGDVIYRELNC